MKAKYSCGPLTVPELCLRSKSSYGWRGIVGVWDVVLRNITWIIHNGQDTKFWKDRWIPGVQSLCLEQEVLVPVSELDSPVSHYIGNDGWDWDRLKACLLDSFCNKIVVIKPPAPGAHSDFPCWDLTSDGQFSLKYTYGILYEVSLEEDPPTSF